jgi:hypothetical protein
LREVEVFNNEGVNVALGKTASQSSTLKDDGNFKIASLAVDGNHDTFSHTNNNFSEYHISACNFPKYHASL